MRQISGRADMYGMHPVAPAADGANALCGLLGLLGTAAILVDATCEIVGMTPAAGTCIGQELLIRNRRLAAEDPCTSRALTDAIGKALRRGRPSTADPVVIARDASQPLILRALPLDPRARSLFRPAHAIIVLLDAARGMLPTEAQLGDMFGLSAGEARLALRLAAGDRIEAAARACDVSYETARKRLKAAFEKTDTRRQAELVALLIRIGSISADASPSVGRQLAARLPITGLNRDVAPALAGSRAALTLAS
ncbi:MAG TPA: hypothetical protein VKX28_26685 [Xanthobacteraceae bacterium]|nr:hypothetical protein [Xanthobacteraceae bacterium]